MARYLILWELDTPRTPVDPKERGSAFEMLQDLVQQDMEKGLVRDWGVFVGEGSGYAVAEGTEVELGIGLAKYNPFVLFKTHVVGSLSQAREIAKSLQQ
ncbi:MAG: hypothetical protein ACXABY_29440 [Candidatus Thorarchaeota archaeon]|jgi:hypothetical protein